MIDYSKVRQIYFYTEPLDMRKGMHGIQILLGYNFSPIEMMYTLFVFCSQNRKQLESHFFITSQDIKKLSTDIANE